MKINFQYPLDLNSVKTEKILPFSLKPNSKSKSAVQEKLKDSRVELLNLLILEKTSLSRKIAITLKVFFLSHLSAWSLNIVAIIIQNFYSHSCFMFPNCFCSNELGLRFYVLLRSLLTYWVFQFYMVYQTFFYLKVIDKRWLKILYFLL